MISKTKIRVLLNNIITSKDDLDQLVEWYKYTLKNWKFVTHITKRSYILASIMESYTGQKMNGDGVTWFLTDASLINLSEIIADYYLKYGVFPSILLCDDIMIHGRNANAVLVRLENTIIQYLKEQSDYKIDEGLIRKDLSKAICIHVYARVSRKSLLLTRYSSCIHSLRMVTPREQHIISNKLSMIISFCGEANTSFIISGNVSSNKFQEIIKDSELIETLYHGIKEYSRIKFISSNSNRIIASITVRYIQSHTDESAKMIPFVFIPQINEHVYRKMIDSLCNLIHQKDYCYMDSDLLKGEISGSERTSAEWITLILSLAILNEEYDKIKERDIIKCIGESELKKISRNYITYFLNEHDIYDILREITADPPLKNSEDLNHFLINVLDEDSFLFKYSGEGTEDRSLIKDILENVFYNGIMGDEKIAYDLEKSYPIINDAIEKKYIRTIRNLFTIIGSRLTKRGAALMVSFLLQMMDAGDVDVISDYSMINGEKCFTQLSKASEQSLSIFPLRLGTDLGIALVSFKFCKSRGRDYKQNLQEYQNSEYYSKENIDNILLFAEVLESFGETPLDWNIMMYQRLIEYNPFNKKDTEEKIQEIAKEAEYKMKQYERFVELI